MSLKRLKAAAAYCCCGLGPVMVCFAPAAAGRCSYALHVDAQGLAGPPGAVSERDAGRCSRLMRAGSLQARETAQPLSPLSCFTTVCRGRSEASSGPALASSAPLVLLRAPADARHLQ